MKFEIEKQKAKQIKRKLLNEALTKEIIALKNQLNL